MKVVCDNCRAVYKVPDDKLTKPVNKATCRNCGHRMLIPRPQPNSDPDEQTVACHVPRMDYHGTGFKMADWFIAFGCFNCHDLVDRRRYRAH